MSSELSGTVITRNIDVSDYIIGNFNDGRLLKTGALLFKKMVNKVKTSIKKLADNRAEEVAFNRFLLNPKTKENEMVKSLSSETNILCSNTEHILVVTDTVEVNYGNQPDKKIKFGINRQKKSNSNKPSTRGFLAHPSVAINAKNKDILGLSAIKLWTRSNDNENKINYNALPVENKESYKWLEAAQETKRNLPDARMLTIVSDRESDIYELFDRVPDYKTHLIIRSMHNRKLTNGLTIEEHMSSIKSSGTYDIELPAITGIRGERKAIIEIKYSVIEIIPPRGTKSAIKNESIRLTCIEAKEIGFESSSEKPVFWRLVTTHPINNFTEAKQIVIWYTWRWNIEQIFRTMKKRGLNIEDSEVREPEALSKLFILALAAAIQVVCLVNARDGKTNRKASDVFTEEEIAVLSATLLKVNGRTKKQQNPYQNGSLSWASWIIARLGGWNGYACERPPGPITMYEGLETFMNYVEGWKLFQKDVCMR